MNLAWGEVTGLAGRIANRLLPAHCVFCGQALCTGHICRQCLPLLPWNDTFCVRCGQPLPAALADNVPCADCQAASPLFRKARAPFVYAFPIDNAIKSMKYRRQLWYAPALSALMQAAFERNFQQCDALVPVPLHRWRQLRRGFNQAFELSRVLARTNGLRILTDVVRSRATRSQSGLSAAERKRNLRGAFGIGEPLRCRRPLIVDDVITTGTTATQLAATLLHAGAAEVNVLAIARVDRFAHYAA